MLLAVSPPPPPIPVHWNGTPAPAIRHFSPPTHLSRVWDVVVLVSSLVSRGMQMCNTCCCERESECVAVHEVVACGYS